MPIQSSETLRVMDASLPDSDLMGASNSEYTKAGTYQGQNGGSSPFLIPIGNMALRRRRVATGGTKVAHRAAETLHSRWHNTIAHRCLLTNAASVSRTCDTGRMASRSAITVESAPSLGSAE